MNPKMNKIAWLEFELTYYDVAVQHVNHYITGIPLQNFLKVLEFKFNSVCIFDPICL